LVMTGGPPFRGKVAAIRRFSWKNPRLTDHAVRPCRAIQLFALGRYPRGQDLRPANRAGVAPLPIRHGGPRECQPASARSESRESNPEEGALCNRPPQSHRQGVSAASIPGRWGRPSPAPGNGSPFRPRRGPGGELHHRQRRAVGREHPHLHPIPKPLQDLDRRRHGGAGRNPLPITTAILTGARVPVWLRGVWDARSRPGLNDQGRERQRNGFFPLLAPRRRRYVAGFRQTSPSRAPAPVAGQKRRTSAGGSVSMSRVQIGLPCGREPAARLPATTGMELSRQRETRSTWQINGACGLGLPGVPAPRTCPALLELAELLWREWGRRAILPNPGDLRGGAPAPGPWPCWGKAAGPAPAAGAALLPRRHLGARSWPRPAAAPTPSSTSARPSLAALQQRIGGF